MAEIVSDRFELRRCISSRGAHLVCEALDRMEGRAVALKVAQGGGEGADGFDSSLAREASIGDLLPQHDNVVQTGELHELHSIDGRPVLGLAMELVNGESLRDWLQRSKANRNGSVAEGLEYFKALCGGVAALHERGILHLDMKPEHVLLDGNVLRICDFDASAVVAADRGSALRPDVPLPAPDAGTLAYLAPERFAVGSVAELDATADVYALGIMLFEILDDRHRIPFSGARRQVRSLHERSPLPEIPWLNGPQRDVLVQCTAKRPRQRLQTVDEVLDAVDEAFPVCPGYGPGQTEQVAGWSAPGTVGSAWPEDEPEAPAVVDGSAAARPVLDELRGLFGSGDLQEMLELAGEAVDICPAHPEHRAIHARLAHRVRAFNANIDACRRAIEAGDLDRALSFARHAVSVSPASVEAQELVGRIERRIQSIESRKQQMISAAQAGCFEEALAIAQDLDEEGVPG